jgi:hypothetical protein
MDRMTATLLLAAGVLLSCAENQHPTGVRTGGADRADAVHEEGGATDTSHASSGAGGRRVGGKH